MFSFNPPDDCCYLIMIGRWDYEIMRDPKGWYAVREDGATSEYYLTSDDAVVAIKARKATFTA